MSETGNYIKLSRKILKWEWYQNPVTRAVFIHLLLKAAYKPTRWQGIELLAGQVITSRRQLAYELGFSERQIRTALDHLQMTNELTHKTTHKYTLINIVNWRVYQYSDFSSDPVNDPVPTHKKSSKRPSERPSEQSTKSKATTGFAGNTQLTNDPVKVQQTTHKTTTIQEYNNIYNVSGTEVPDTDIIPEHQYEWVAKRAAENNETPLEFWRRIQELRR